MTTRQARMPAEKTSHPNVIHGGSRRAHNDELRSAPEPEYRGARISPGGPRTAGEFREAIEEMRRNDPEWQEWQSAERLGELTRGMIG